VCFIDVFRCCCCCCWWWCEKKKEKVLVGCFFSVVGEWEREHRDRKIPHLYIRRGLNESELFVGRTVDTHILRVCMMPFLMAAYEVTSYICILLKKFSVFDSKLLHSFIVILSHIVPSIFVNVAASVVLYVSCSMILHFMVVVFTCFYTHVSVSSVNVWKSLCHHLQNFPQFQNLTSHTFLIEILKNFTSYCKIKFHN
jgi:hypothetical protein